ncbi:hypothetical protein V8E54_003350 [Elaphomyces granulatus]
MKQGNREQVDSAEPSPKRRRVEFDVITLDLAENARPEELRKRSDSDLEKLREQLSDLDLEKLRKQQSDSGLENLYDQLSSPACATELPFPFPGKGKPVERFAITDGIYWSYVGREYFTTLLNEVTQLMGSGTRKFSLHETIGYGKSYLLAALTNALDVEEKNGDTVSNDRKKDVLNSRFCLKSWGPFPISQRTIINKIGFTSQHKVIYSASANYQARVRTVQTQTNDKKLYVYGGFSAKEMEQWWIRKKDALPDEYKAGDLETFKPKIEDITGCIPLLLDRCIVKEKIDPSAPKLNEVFSQVQDFMLKIQKEHSTGICRFYTPSNGLAKSLTYEAIAIM